MKVMQALLLSLPKFDVSYRKAQANELDLSTHVQIQVPSTWFCSCLYRNDLARVRAPSHIAKSVEVGSEFGPIWSIAHPFCNVTLETQSWTCGHVLPAASEMLDHRVPCRPLVHWETPTGLKGGAGCPTCHCSLQFIQVKSPRQGEIAFPPLCREDLWDKPRG